MKRIRSIISALLRGLKFLIKERQVVSSLKMLPQYLEYFETYPPDQFLRGLSLWCKSLAELHGRYYYKSLKQPLACDEYLVDFYFNRRNKIKRTRKRIIHKPKITLIMSVFSGHPKLTAESLNSLKKQLYNNWELYVLGRGRLTTAVTELIEATLGKDARVTMKFAENLEKNFTAILNETINDANGKFIGFLSEGDKLTERALLEVADLLDENPNAKVIYSDHALVNNKRYVDIIYKPGWSPDLLLAKYYIKNLLCCERDMISAVGGMHGIFEDEIKYDLLLRIVEKTNEVYHIPKVLYHEEVPKSSYVKGYNADYCIELQKKALENHIKRSGIEAEVCNGIFKGSFRVLRKINLDSKVSIIIPTKDDVDKVRICINSIVDKTSLRAFEIIIVDNDSSQSELLDYLEECSHVVLRFPGDFNFSTINNFAAAQASGEYLVFLNNDTEVISPEWLEAMLEHAQRKEVGVVGAKLLYPDGLVQHAGIELVRNQIPDHVHRFTHSCDQGRQGMVDVIRNYNAVTGACMMIRADVFNEVGGFDESFPITYNDVDLCLKVRARGYLIVYTPYAVLYHHEGISRWMESDQFVTERNLFFSRWGLI